MRERIIAGIVIACLGVFVLVQGLTYSSRSDVLKVGDLKVTATERSSVPPWIGGAAVLVGAALILAGSRKKV